LIDDRPTLKPYITNVKEAAAPKDEYQQEVVAGISNEYLLDEGAKKGAGPGAGRLLVAATALVHNQTSHLR
jgi:hypothetical protein